MLTLALTVAAASCGTAPLRSEEVPLTSSLAPPQSGALVEAAQRARTLGDGDRSSTGDSGVYLLDDGLSALAARIALMSMAESSLDLQYYIFGEDTTSRIVLALALQAADRGVRVRLLLDDLGTPVQTPSATALDQHPNVEIRIFNPVAARGGARRLLQQAAAFHRANHRMHNKLLVADGTAMITGGRNVADEYFSHTNVDFQDIDALVVGAVLPEAADCFDRYWNSAGAVPLRQLLPPSRRTPVLEGLREQAPAYLAENQETEFAAALRDSSIVRSLTDGVLPFHWGKVTLLADPPEKALQHDELPQDEYLGYALREVVARARQRLHVSSAYFVPGKGGVQLFAGLAERGVEVRILTNSLASTDVAIVHSGYARYRVPLLEAGVELWELNSEAGRDQQWFKGKSRASLHAKAMLVDDNAAFIGSVNLDPRSIVQNTEIGILVESAEVNQQLARTLSRWTDEEQSWRLGLDDRGDLLWQGREQGQPVVLRTEPETSAWQRFRVWLLSWLPVEAQI